MFILNFWKEFYKYKSECIQDYYTINIYRKYNIEENMNILFDFIREYKCRNEIIIFNKKVMLYICYKKGINDDYDSGKAIYTDYLAEIFDNYLDCLDKIVHSSITIHTNMRLVTKYVVNIYLSYVASKFNSNIKNYCAEYNDNYNLCVKYLRTVKAIYDNFENAIFIRDDDHVFMNIIYKKKEDEYFVKSDNSIVHFTIDVSKKDKPNDKILTHHYYKYSVDIKNKDELYNRIMYKFEDRVNDIIDNEI